MNDPVAQYFAYPPDKGMSFDVAAPLSVDSGFFRFGPDLICYGKSSSGYRSATSREALYDAGSNVAFGAHGIRLPFDFREIVTNLTTERYLHQDAGRAVRLMRQIYYLARPFLSTSLRSPLQRLYFETRQKSPFPAWPVDTSADDLMNRLLFLGMKAAGIDELPFIWFWPNGANACSIMTHDVEAEVGKKFCSQLMDVNEELGLPASFQIVPEQRYEVTPGFIDEIKRRGFEVNVQDLNHDGRLFWDYADFSNKVKRINQYARDFGAAGFRAAVLYRNEEWFNLLDFEYDMSIPNSARYDPQPGGCCTVMPYFIGNILELPVTTAQDHTVFHYLKKYSLELWREQINRIVGTHGLASFIFHPDYLIDPAALIVYKELVQELTSLQASNTLWIARPGEVNEWWRNRAAMKLVFRNGEWIIEGKGKERACVAFASIADDRIVYTVPKGKEISVS